MTKSTDASLHALDGDRPVADRSGDRLGFGEMATVVARSIVAQVPSPGLVIGLEGAWGSGKSSLLNLTVAELKKLGSDGTVKVLEFRPWLIGNRDHLLGSLLADMAKVIDEIQADRGDLSGKAAAKAKVAAESIRKFASRLSGSGKLIAAAGILVPGAQLAGQIVEGVGNAADSAKFGQTLAQLKHAVATDLEKLGVPIVVTIDDVDRLEPAEVIELLRLVRSVADLPNVIYVLCYDHGVLARAIEKAASVSDGSAFLEKIVQVLVQAPLPEPYELRAWFSQQLETMTGPIGPDMASRVQHVIDIEGGKRLRTPRAVVRALNSLRFELPALGGKTDLADLVWLHLIKASNTSLYRWIEDYLAAYAVTSRGRAHLSQISMKADDENLRRILKEEGRVLQDEVYNLGNHLPGIRRMHLSSDGDKPFVWGDQGEAERNAAIMQRRLSSPDHYRLYFALNLPAVTPQASDFLSLDEALDASPQALEQLLLAWSTEQSSLGVSRLELVFERLNGGGRQLDSDRFEKLWLGFADILDGPLTNAIVDVWGRTKLWALARPIIAAGFREMPPVKRDKLLRKAYQNGQALAWLADFFRDELFAHGRVGNERRHGQQALEEASLDMITPIILKRLTQAGPRNLIAMPNGYGNLLAWAQGSEPGDQSAAWVEVNKMAKTDAGLIEILESLRSRTMSHGDDGRARFDRYLGRGSVGLFLDYDLAKARLEKLAQGRSRLRDRAGMLLRDMANARHY
jgi:KAP family P-loop domain